MNILILEDHQGAQQWLSQAVRLAFRQDVQISLADSIEAVLTILDTECFDLFIVDLHLPDGSGNLALLRAKQNCPDMPCVVATIYSDEDHLYPALKAGADGYVLKDDSQEEIADMLKDIKNGKPPLSAEIAKRLLFHFRQPEQAAKEKTAKANTDRDASAASSTPDPQHGLTPRETETLKYLVKGFSIRECAEFMGISPHTVSGHVKCIYKKWHVSSRAEVTAEAARLGLFL